MRASIGLAGHWLWRAHLTALPPACWQCGRLLPRVPWRAASPPGHPFLCAACHEALPWRDAAADDGGIAGVARVWAAFHYEPPLPYWIQQLKYARRDGLLPLLGALLAAAPAARGAREASVVMPVPLHPRRLWQRGFNQSLLLAHRWRHVLAQQGPERAPPRLAADVLTRHRYTRPQVRMRAAERHANVADAFSLHPRLAGTHRPLRGESVLLVDDVATTGATLSACAAVLRAAGAARVEALVLARARRDDASGAGAAA